MNSKNQKLELLEEKFKILHTEIVYLKEIVDSCLKRIRQLEIQIKADPIQASLSRMKAHAETAAAIEPAVTKIRERHKREHPTDQTV